MRNTTRDGAATADLKTAASAFGVSYRTARKLVREGRFPCSVVQVGHQFKVPIASLREVLGDGVLR